MVTVMLAPGCRNDRVVGRASAGKLSAQPPAEDA